MSRLGQSSSFAAILAGILFSSCQRLNLPSAVVVTAFVVPTTSQHSRIMSTTTEPSTSRLWDSERDRAVPLPLTSSDLERLTALQTRHKTLPLLIMDALVPGQSITLESSDPRFHSLVHYVLSDQGEGELAMVGLNPQTGLPMSVGVTLPIYPEDVQVNVQTKVVTVQAKAKNRMEVQGEPWLLDDDPTITYEHHNNHDDDTLSAAAFYLADIEVTDERREGPLGDDTAMATQKLANQIPDLIETWVHELVLANPKTALKMESRMTELGSLPPSSSSWTEQAMWVAALLNPTTATSSVASSNRKSQSTSSSFSSKNHKGEERVCLEIRPAMLSCQNDHDRILLATTALQSSIDHISGKNRLF